MVGGGRTGRRLPRDYPGGKSGYHDCRQGRDNGTGHQLHDPRRAQGRQQTGRHQQPTAGGLASQRVKTTASAGVRGDDNGTQSTGRQRQVLGDTLGVLLGVGVTAAAVPDRAGARLGFNRRGGAGKKLRLLWVAGASRGHLVSGVAEPCRVLLRPVWRAEDQKGFVVVARRWVGERTWAGLNQSRRLSKDYAVLLSSSEAMIDIAMIRLRLRRLAAA